MPEIKFDPSRVVPIAPMNSPLRLSVGHIGAGETLGVGGAYCGCQRAGRYGFNSFEDDKLLKLPDLRKMHLEKESEDVHSS